MSQPCTTCNGNGFVKFRKADGTFEDRDCPICLGSKELTPEFLLPCSKCGRGGWISDKSLPADHYPKLICDYCLAKENYVKQQEKRNEEGAKGPEGSQPEANTSIGSNVEQQG